MSNDLLLTSLEQNAQAVASLRHHAALFAAIACWEDVGTEHPLDSLPRALVAYLGSLAGPDDLVEPPSFSTGAGGHTYALATFAEAGTPPAQRDAAHRAFTSVVHRMSGLMCGLPDAVRRRLGFREVYATPLHDWAWVLFRLAWHFPEHFARGVVRRDRFLRKEYGPIVAPEDWVQLGGFTNVLGDYFPGIIFSKFPHELDLVTATGYAIDLLRRAVQGGGAFEVTDSVRDQLRRLHQEFAAGGQLARSLPKGARDLELKVLRLDNSFRTPPASEWAAFEAGGAIQETLYLARCDAAKEVCVVRGGSTSDFLRRVDRAGALLSAWSDPPGVPLLQDAAQWAGRVARYRELLSQQFFFTTEDGSAPHGEPVPREQIARHYWDSTRLSSSWGGMVTDHRGNAERWLAFVLYVFKEFEPDAVEIRTVPADSHRSPYGWNAILTLREMNIYEASARAMELAGWVCPASGQATGSRPSAESATGVRAVRFDDPWPEAGYPPPDAGRYVRWSRGDGASDAGPQGRPGWAWATNPEDGWVECGETHTPLGLVPIAQGSPPAVCDWLPRDWPADFYPLGRTVEHCTGWRELVRSVLAHGADTIPPDDRRFGWRTLARATRQLAHHLGAITLDRVTAPLPALRGDAWREVEPVLDGLVSIASQPADEGNGELVVPAERGKKLGRPTDETKQQAVAFVKELREKRTPWKEIPALVFKRFKVKYTSETLRGYLKG